MSNGNLQHCKDVSWDAEDLLSCKQAFIILSGLLEFEELVMLDFGNLDCYSVAKELGLFDEYREPEPEWE